MHGLQACLFEYITVAAFRIYLSLVKMLLKVEAGGHELKSHGSYIVDHGKSWKNHGVVFFDFCENPVILFLIHRYFFYFPGFGSIRRGGRVPTRGY